jgi:two-component system NtrC family sensor kinase
MADIPLPQRAEAALNERVKELTCLYGIAQIAGKPQASLEKILRGIVKLLPAAWQYPEITHAQIVLDERSFTTPHFCECLQKQTADIVVGGEHRGVVEVCYAEKKADLDEGPFLKEERSLIDAVAKQVALIIERRQAEEDRARLQNQLRHADRLATIGVLAAGVAHELNEPLGGILGFAQLAKKCPGLPKAAAQDLKKIEAASLHAREVIKKLLIFARQMPPQKTEVDLHKIVEDTIDFVHSRCIEGGIEVGCSLPSELPEITADPAQLSQVLMNLVVNALQAMPQGGKLIIRAGASKDFVSLIIEDTGIGMSKDVVEQISVPFFTTKDVGQGTGLGFPVVDGIVKSHGGSIRVESELGHGTRIEIRLPVEQKPSPEETD